MRRDRAGVCGWVIPVPHRLRSAAPAGINVQTIREQLDYSPDPVPWRRRARVRRWLLVAGVLVLLVPTVFLAVISYQLNGMRRNLDALDAGYQRVERGMTVVQVQTLMRSNGTPHTGHSFPAWDDEPLDPAEAKRIATTLRYHGPRPLMPVIFEFTFDQDGKVVGKHRYD